MLVFRGEDKPSFVPDVPPVDLAGSPPLSADGLDE